MQTPYKLARNKTTAKRLLLQMSVHMSGVHTSSQEKSEQHGTKFMPFLRGGIANDEACTYA